jgi:putative redox protein
MISSTRCTFDSARGHRLAARLDRPTGRPERGSALFAHCFTCSSDLRVERQIAKALTAQGYAVLSFDFTGLGRSEGEFGEGTFTADVDDLVAAAAYLGTVVAPPALLVGHSLGGAAVLSATSRIDSVAAVATIGAPSDPSHVEHVLGEQLEQIAEDGSATVTIAGRSFTIGREFVEDLRNQRLVQRMPELDAALLLLHSPRDELVGVDNARVLYDAAKHPKSFVSLDHADHLLSDERDARYAAQVIGAWAERYLPTTGEGPAATSEDPAMGEGSSTAEEGSAQPPAVADEDAPALPLGPGSYDTPGATALTEEGFATPITSRGFTLRADEPASVGGTETGPTPYDYLAAALASCTSLTLRIYADRKGYALSSAEVGVTHDRVHSRDCMECESGSGFVERFSRTIVLEGDLTEAERADLIRIADRCPVHKSLHGQIEVHTTTSG